MKLKLLKEKKVLILGLAREGESSFKFLRKKFPKKQIGLADKLSLSKLSPSMKELIKKDSKIQTHLGKNYLNALKDYDIILKSPGIPLKTISPYLTKNQIITSQTDIFLEKYAGQTIGVTGTKGKSTTSSLIYSILNKAGFKTELIGNIGKPALSYFANKPSKKIFVFELSSHQLQNIKVSPHIAVFLNIFQEHGDYYSSKKDYFLAKQNITKWQKQSDYFIFNADSKLLRDLAKKTKAKKISYCLKCFESKLKPNCYLKDSWIYFNKKRILNINTIPLRGEHNILNTMAAIATALILGASQKNIEEAIGGFSPLPHRLEFVGNFQGIKFFNDSLATIPEATIQAIKSIPNIQTIILGGFDRGQDFKNLAKIIIKREIKNLILFPTTGKKIYQELGKQTKKIPDCFFADSMKEAVKIALRKTKNGVCLLSPASASFELFKNYQDRGDQFKKYIKLLTNDKKKSR